MREFIGAIDQGTTSTRFILFDRNGYPAYSNQLEHRQHFPQSGWVEHDPEEIWRNTLEVMRKTAAQASLKAGELKGIGITNQRETTVAWHRTSGKALGRAIVWQDTRTRDIVAELAAHAALFREHCGIQPATYFAAPKIIWMLRNCPEVARAAEEDSLCFGTIDSWLIWRLTGGRSGSRCVIDVTNASRTMLMNLEMLEWDSELLSLCGIRKEWLPEIVSSIPAEPLGRTTPGEGFVDAVPVAGILGDQQAALFGQACYEKGASKNTYGTGCFLLMNTGEEIVPSRFGLLSTCAYRWGDKPAVYALEGSVAVAGALVQWLRDNLGLIGSSSEIETLARTVDDAAGLYFVPAFSGLFAPHWRDDARGLLIGLTGFIRNGHIARAVLEASAYQTLEIFEAMAQDSGHPLQYLKVDGGMVVNELLMQFQADLLDVPVIRPRVTETTALGAAYAAGLGIGIWSDLAELKEHWAEDARWVSSMDGDTRQRLCNGWKKAVERSKGWIETE